MEVHLAGSGVDDLPLSERVGSCLINGLCDHLQVAPELIAVAAAGKDLAVGVGDRQPSARWPEFEWCREGGRLVRAAPRFPLAPACPSRRGSQYLLPLGRS